MKKIVDDSIIDIVPFTYGFVYAKKETDENGNIRAAFYCFNAQTQKVEAVRRSGYLHTKFGENFEKISQIVGNFIFCDCATLPTTGETVALFPESKMYFIDNDGSLIWDEELCYRESPVKGLAADDDCVWCVVPEKNAIVRFSPSAKKVYIRIGGNESTTFDDPVGVSKVGNSLFVCCGKSKKIRKIDLQTYSIKDYRMFDEGVYKYFRVLGKEYVLLKSGFYML
ncbi:MAG: hypothetical protein E7536_04575 [Ruminococcaceae bacterium]|nr:hypothetical protein [Oscillospiraceae bacterium]